MHTYVLGTYMRAYTHSYMYTFDLWRATLVLEARAHTHTHTHTHRCERWRATLAQGTRREPRAESKKRQFLTAVVIFRCPNPYYYY